MSRPSRRTLSRRSGTGVRTGLLLSLTGFLPTLLSAVDLKNEDSKTYEVKVHEGASTTHTSVSGGSTRVNLTKEGTVEVIGAGSFRASGVTRVIIRDGRLIFE